MRDFDLGDLLMGIMLVAFAIMFICMIIMIITMENTTNYTRIPLMQLSDDSRINGNFFLGSGSISSNPVFYYYSGSDKTGYSLEYKRASETKIFMDEETKPYLGYSMKCWTNMVNSFLQHGPNCTIIGDFEFHIPKGSIREYYTLDGV